MTKPWEEEWKLHTREKDVVVLPGSGKVVIIAGHWLRTSGPKDFARARLAVQAPRLYRALESLVEAFPPTGSEEEDEALEFARKVLREARGEE